MGLLIAMVWIPAATGQPGQSFGREAAPENIYRDFHIIDDVAGPGRMVSNDWAFAQFFPWDNPLACPVPAWTTILRGIGGENGSRVYSKDIGYWHKFPGPILPCGLRVWMPIRLGWPAPYYGVTPIDNMQTTTDVNGDGVQDLLTYGWHLPYYQGSCGLYTWCYDGSLDGRDGYTGDSMWQIPIKATRYDDGNLYRLIDYPTALYVFDGPTGSRFVWKLSNVTFSYASGLWVYEERVMVGNSADGKIRWDFTFLNATDYPFNRYITGAGQLSGDAELEIFWDDWAQPPCLGCPPDATDIGALRGEDVPPTTVPGLPFVSRILWGPSNCFTPPQTGNDVKQSEETAEHALFMHASVIGDVNDDKLPEGVCTYLTVNLPGANGDSTSRNGRLKAHVHPHKGYNGAPFWPGVDIKQQGWGFVSDVNEPIAYRYESWGSKPTNEGTRRSMPYLALGTADLPSGTLRGGKFPPKDTRLTTLAMDDGGPVWGTYMAPLAQNDNAVINWALKQYATNLAGHDYNGDGMRDLLSAAEYPTYSDQVQVLLSTTSFNINVIDALTGDEMRSLQPWGPKGMVIACPNDTADDITILTGHARRIDAYRYKAFVDELNWREPWYLNPRAQAQTAGIGFLHYGARCGDTSDERTGIGQDMVVRSLRRGPEILPIYGYVNETGGYNWLRPSLPYRPPLNASLEGYLDVVVPPPALKDTIGMSLLSVGGGVGAAFASIALFNARRRGVGA